MFVYNDGQYYIILYFNDTYIKKEMNNNLWIIRTNIFLLLGSEGKLNDIIFKDNEYKLIIFKKLIEKVCNVFV